MLTENSILDVVLVKSAVYEPVKTSHSVQSFEKGLAASYIAPPPLPSVLCPPPEAVYHLFVELCTAEGASNDGRTLRLADFVFGLLPELSHEADTFQERLTTIIQVLAVFTYGRKLVRERDSWDELRYEAILSPSAHSFQSLIGLRQHITEIHRHLKLDLGASVRYAMYQTTVQRTKRGNDLLGLSARLKACHVDPGQIRSILALVARLATDTDDIKDDLNGDIQLAIGAATIQDSDAMKQQAERATLLTTLAAVYLPLTLVTGIFGMNIREISQGQPRFWWCFVILVVVGLATIVLVLGYNDWTRFRKFEERERRRDELTRSGMLVTVSRDKFANDQLESRTSKTRHILKFFHWWRTA